MGCTRLPDSIGEVKSLRTLSGFTVPMDSLESLHLCFTRAMQRAEEATWMTALSTSLDKLCGLKKLRMDPSDIFQSVALCADDALGSLSPAFRNLEVLDVGYGCTLSRVPRWIGCLRGLCELQLGAKQLLQEDVAIMGTRLPSLVYLSLRIPGIPTGRITVGGSTGFPSL
nr:unnamed protein product [Digitaria exilis]